MLFNLIIESPDNKGFSISSPINLKFNINADKILNIAASCQGIVCKAEPINPYANKEMTTEERIIAKAQRDFNIEASDNGGVPSRKAFNNLRQAYENADKDLDAAEVYEQEYEYYPDAVSLNNLAVLYNNAGDKEKALEYYEKALQKEPNNSIVLSNIGLQYFYTDKEKARYYFERSLSNNPNNPVALIRLADMEEDDEKAMSFYNKAFDIYKDRMDYNSLSSSDRYWFKSVAEKLGRKDIVKKINEFCKEDKNTLYNDDNLTKTSSPLIDK